MDNKTHTKRYRWRVTKIPRSISRHACDLRRLIFYHEAGHAIVARKLGVEIAGVDVTAKDDQLFSAKGVRTGSARRVAEQLAVIEPPWHAVIAAPALLVRRMNEVASAIRISPGSPPHADDPIVRLAPWVGTSELAGSA